MSSLWHSVDMRPNGQVGRNGDMSSMQWQLLLFPLGRPCLLMMEGSEWCWSPSPWIWISLFLFLGLYHDLFLDLLER